MVHKTMGNISVWECENCNTTYRTKSVIRRWWGFCPNCGSEIKTWSKEEKEVIDDIGHQRNER